MALTPDQEMTVSLYKAYLEDLGRIGGRHETARAFYLSVISALFVFLSLAGTDGALLPIRGEVQVVVGLVGILICIAWFRHMKSFAVLYSAKLDTLANAEARFPFQPFMREREFLQANKRTRLTTVDRFVAVVFIALFVALALLKAT